MYAAVASLLIRRRRILVQIFDQLRCFSTQTLATDEGGARRRRRRSGIPKLLVPSQRNPQTCSLFGLGSQLGTPCLKFECKIHLPAIAAMDKTLCIGSSPDGFLFFTSKLRPTTDIFALNPLTGAYLPLPSAASTLRPLPSSSVDDARALFSPSRGMIVLNRFHFADFACLCGNCNGARWTPLPDHFGHMQDLIFHKGLLYGVDSARNLAVFDFNNPSSSTLHLDLHPLRTCGDDPERCYSWLVESPDGKDLFLVFRYVRTPGPHPSFKFSNPLSFKVYKLIGNGIWKRVYSIGDMAIFVGISQSMSLSATDFPNTLIRNTIYFTQSRAVTSSQSPVPCTGAFSLDDERRPTIFVKTADANDVVSSAPPSPHVWLTPVYTTVPQGPYAKILLLF